MVGKLPPTQAGVIPCVAVKSPRRSRTEASESHPYSECKKLQEPITNLQFSPKPPSPKA